MATYRIVDGALDARQRRSVKNNFAAMQRTGQSLRVVADVDGCKGGPAVQVLAFARDEVVDDEHVVTTGNQGIDEIGANESGAAGDRHLHARASSSVGCARRRCSIAERHSSTV